MHHHLIPLLFCVFTVCLSGCNARDANQPDDKKRPHVSAGDFFFYSCVNSYMRTHDIPAFDSSVGYAVEYSTLGAKQLNSIHEAASQVALGIPAPKFKDPEHGGQAVLVKCQRAAKQFQE